MKKVFKVLICITAVVSVMFNVVQINNRRKISNDISNYIVANIHQLNSFYESMYSNDKPTEYYDSSLLYIDDVCDSIEEELVFYNTLYPKRTLLLRDIIADYKMLVRVLKNNDDVAKEAYSLHKRLQQYILNYNNANYGGNTAKTLYETDMQIQIGDNRKYLLLHDEIVKISKE
ncbi:MAG: hypothetical protein IJN96_06840 [Clostridia bacterium]|nr:hypothetical protein [Clostridia bacterium]